MWFLRMLSRRLCACWFLAGLLVSVLSSQAQPVRRVVVFGVDGLSPKCIEKASTPFMCGLMRTGLWTLHARAVLPTVSSPNWAAMIMGAAPDLTGVTSNDWQPDKYQIAPACIGGTGGYAPTIFGLIRKERPNVETCL